MAYGQGGLFRRLIDYKVCYSMEDEFWLKYVIITPEMKLDGKPFASLLEKLLLKNIGTQAEKSYSDEWLINADTKKLERFLFQTLNLKFTRLD